MLAWLFPGQGTQTVGMGQDLYAGSPAARETLELADQVLDFPLTHLMFQGPAEELQATINAQPAIVATSLAAMAALREAWAAVHDTPLPRPALVAGHSVGEYSALVASGAADAATALRLVRARAEAMHDAGQRRPGGMTAVLGLSREAVAEACGKAREEVPESYVAVANHNADTQVIIAGDPDGLAAAARHCQAAGARRCVPLAVSAAFHSAAMAPAEELLRRAVEAARLRDAAVPVVANAAPRPVTSAAELADELVTQVAQPVLWVDCLRVMRAAGVGAFLELGPGKVLTNLLTRLEPAPAAAAAGDMDGVRAAVRWLQEQAA
ncbi:MAG TPA: ACP S-malonyltransferase [Chloroflexota bacterium]|nr:ACP S-malonyltransferase [Chloroflexota bacterium]